LKRAAPVAATGPGGAHFEGQVGAHYLLTMLAGGVPRGLPGTIIDSVAFQRANDHPLDDVVVRAHDAAGNDATQRREAISAELAKRQNKQLQADLERARQAAVPPMVLTPNSPPTATKRPVDRSKSTRCEDGSLSCSWAKFSAAVKNAFVSSSRTSPNPMLVPD
jgi:hypothetical protein